MLLTAMLATHLMSAQIPPVTETAGELPKIVPPSPEVASLARLAQMSTGLHTGSANVSVPLYNMVVGNISLPVQLSYSTNGIKVTEIPSRVGLGWNLVAGGSISRVVHDEPDGESTFLTAPSNFQDFSQSLLDYLHNANEENNDTEHDEYSISAPGLSGKFYFDATGTIRFTSHSNLKVITGTNPGTASSVFIVVNTDGTKYYFGELDNAVNRVERTVEVKANSKESKFKTMTTAWFLTRIVSPEGHTITFTYTSIQIRTQQGPFQTATLNAQGYSSAGQDCGFCIAPAIPAVEMNTIIYNTFFLNSITASNGQYINFSYEDRPDISYDNRLTGIEVFGNHGNSSMGLLKKYQFEYEDLNTWGWNTKFYLKKIHSLSGGNPATESQAHEFAYVSGTLPSAESLAQDYFGYYRGSASGFHFFPRPPEYSSYINGNLGADRSPVFEYAQRGALQKVTYPTGGYEEFEYEPHTILQYQSNTSYSSLQVTGSGTGQETAQVFTSNFTANAHQTSNLTLEVYANTSNPNARYIPYTEPGQSPVIAILQIIKTSGSQNVFYVYTRSYGNETYSVPLEAGVSYQVKLTVYGSAHTGKGILQYNPSTITSPVNVPGCGIRVSKINAYDPVTNKISSKYYKYASLADLTKSSGVGTLTGSPWATAHLGGWCVVPPAQMGQSLIECPNGSALQVSSSSLTSIYTFSGSPIAYTHVIESDAPDLANGGTEHEFYAYYIGGGGAPVLNYPITTAPVSVQPDMNGLEKRTTIFKRQGSSLVVLKNTLNEYSYDNRVNNYHVNTAVRKRWEPTQQSGNSYEEKARGYDATQYYMFNGWIHLDKTTTISYDQDGLNPETNEMVYEYGSTVHMQPTKMTTADSKGLPLTVDMKYTADYTTAPFTDMVQQNMITALIEKTVKRNNNVLSVKKTNYSKWHDNTNNLVIRPVSVENKIGSNTQEERIVYHAIDTKGNPLSLSKKDDIKVSYIWDYQGSFPVAEVKNATHLDIAATSFEADGRGNWEVQGTLLPEGSSDLVNYWTLYTNDAMTGTTSFGGRMTKAVNSGTTYIVTLWCKNGYSATVNSNAGSLVSSKNGWNLYKWEITGQSFVTVQGNHIDEVRLHPKNALMTTYTHKGFIGVSSVCDVNNNITHYEYDVMNRLALVRDDDKSILKKYEYTYKASVPCANTATAWENTLTPQRCQKNGYDNTGFLEQEQRDLNPCSSSFNQIRWVTAGENTTTCPVVLPSTTLTYNNLASVSGFTVTLTNTVTSQMHYFSMPSSGSGTLGTVPVGTYNIVISKPPQGIGLLLLFGTGCQYQGDPWTATFYNVVVESCHDMSIDFDLL